jgi:transcription elongation factor Elf1
LSQPVTNLDAREKSQTPSSKPQGKSKTQKSETSPRIFRFLNILNLGASLMPGIWDFHFCGGTTPARSVAVQNSLRKVTSDPDIFFHCQHCKAALVANRSAAGMTLTCQKCGQPTTVPKLEEPSANALVYAEELRGKLTENESQRAEVTGNINQLTIQLHRWQLRLQTLNERKAQLEKELGQR